MCITKWRKSIRKGCILLVFNYMTFQKKQNSGDNKRWVAVRIERRDGWTGKAQRTFVVVRILCMILCILMDIRHYTVVQAHRMYNIKGKPTGKYGVWVSMVCQSRFTLCKTCTTLVSDIDNGEVTLTTGIGGRWEISSQFCCKPKTGLKD